MSNKPAGQLAATDTAMLLDDPQEWSAFGRPHGRRAAADMPPTQTAWESHVVLEGMHCTACALTIEDALR